MITNKKAQNWRTPPPGFRVLHREYGFTVDLAASLGNALLPRYFTRAHNSLLRSWVGEIGFYNPPFGMIPEWLYKAGNEAARGAFSVGLLPANLETRWFHDLAIYFDKHTFRGRVKYIPPPGVEASQPSFASMLVIIGPGVTPSGLGFSRTRDGNTFEYVPTPALDSLTQQRRLAA